MYTQYVRSPWVFLIQVVDRDHSLPIQKKYVHYTKNETHCHSSLTEWSETRGLQDYPLSQFTCCQDMWCQLLELEANLEIE